MVKRVIIILIILIAIALFLFCWRQVRAAAEADRRIEGMVICPETADPEIEYKEVK